MSTNCRLVEFNDYTLPASEYEHQIGTGDETIVPYSAPTYKSTTVADDQVCEITAYEFQSTDTATGSGSQLFEITNSDDFSNLWVHFSPDQNSDVIAY